MQTGLWMAPAGITMLLVSPLSSMSLTRLGGCITLAIGSGVLASGYIFAVFMTDAPWKLMVAASVASAGVAIAYAAMPTLTMNNVPQSKASSSVGVNALMRSIGSTVAGAVMAIMLTSNKVAVGDASVAPQSVFLLCFVIGAAADADVILTDGPGKHAVALAPFQVTAEVLAYAPARMKLVPCPPFIRGREVSRDAIDHPAFVGYAFKRSLLPVQQAVMAFVLGAS